MTDLAIALNGQDYTLNKLEFAYYTQPISLTHLTPIQAGPSAGGSAVTVHGAGLAAFAGWGAPPGAARCRWDGTQVTIPSALTATYVVCATACHTGLEPQTSRAQKGLVLFWFCYSRVRASPWCHRRLSPLRRRRASLWSSR